MTKNTNVPCRIRKSRVLKCKQLLSSAPWWKQRNFIHVWNCDYRRQLWLSEIFWRDHQLLKIVQYSLANLPVAFVESIMHHIPTSRHGGVECICKQDESQGMMWLCAPKTTPRTRDGKTCLRSVKSRIPPSGSQMLCSQDLIANGAQWSMCPHRMLKENEGGKVKREKGR